MPTVQEAAIFQTLGELTQRGAAIVQALDRLARRLDDVDRRLSAAERAASRRLDEMQRAADLRHDHVEKRANTIKKETADHLRRLVDRRLQRIEDDLIVRVDRRVGAVERELRASNFNALARRSNEMIRSPHDRLTPLRNRHNHVIAPFPASSRDIRDLRTRDLDDLLAKLGSGTTSGDRSHKLKSLRLLIGLRTDVS